MRKVLELALGGVAFDEIGISCPEYVAFAVSTRNLALAE
jgi:hypothetical protein